MVIFGRVRRGSREGEKLVTIPKNSDIKIGDPIMFKKAPLEDFDNLFGEVKKNRKRK